MLEYVDCQLLPPEMLPALIAEKKRMEAASNSNAAEKKRLEKQKADTMRKAGNIIDFMEGGKADETIIELLSEYVLDKEKIKAVLKEFQKKEKSPETVRAIMDTFVASVNLKR